MAQAKKKTTKVTSHKPAMITDMKNWEANKLYVNVCDIEYLDTRSTVAKPYVGVVKLRTGDQVKFREGELVVV